VSTRNPKSEIRNLWWLAIPSLIVIAAIGFDWLPILRGNGEWQWPLRQPVEPVRLLVPLGALALYSLIAMRWLSALENDRKRRQGGERRFLLFLTLAAPLLQLALAYGVSHVPLLEFFGPTVSVHNSGYFTTAVATPDLNQLLANYPASMSQLPIHAQSHPPGPIVVQWLSWQFFKALPPVADVIAMPLRTLQCHNPGIMALDNAQIASATLGMLLPLIGALAVWPLYAFGKRSIGARGAALAALLWPVLPLFAMWPAQWDQTYPLLLLIGLYLAHTGLERNSNLRVFAAGVPLSIASFFSVGNFVLMVIVALYGMVGWWATARRIHATAGIGNRLQPTVRSGLKLTAAFALGCLSIWIAYAVIYGVNPLDVIATGSRLAFESTTGNRTYGAWLIGNPIDFAVFLGAPVIITLIAGLVDWLRHRLRRAARLGSATDTGKSTANGGSWVALLVAAFGTLIALILSGIVRGEVGRLWMTFGPLMALIAANWLTRDSSLVTHHSSPFTRHSSLVIALLALQLLTMNTRWLVNDSFLDAPPERSANFVAPQPSFGTDYSFAQRIALRGYDAQASSGSVDLTLYWQALAQPAHAYTVFAHVIDARGQPAGQQDNMPVHDQLPTSCWQPGEYVTDPYTIQLAPGAQGPFQVEVGLYRLETGIRLAIDNSPETSVRLAVP
jgi:hypothetical protein